MSAPNLKKIKKGDLLFNEGDISKSMYFIQSGTIRLFKKKGNSSVELGLLQKGEIIGEMGFLDGGPRSASAEAMHEASLTEITTANLAEQMKLLPAWLMVLLKTIVNRLRSANNKIRQLETSSTAYTYGSDGVSMTYQFLSNYDVLKICTAALVSALTQEEAGTSELVTFPMGKIIRYANHIMGIHVSKITEMLDVLERTGLAHINRLVPDKIEVSIMDVNQLEMLVYLLNDENLKEHEKKANLSSKAVFVMGLLAKYLDQYEPNAEGISTINVGEVIENEKTLNEGKEPFKIDDSFNELVKSKLCTEPEFKDGQTILTRVRARDFVRLHKMHEIFKELETINNKKREQAARGTLKR